MPTMTWVTFSSRTKHLLHCCLLTSVIFGFALFTRTSQKKDSFNLNPVEKYGICATIILYFLRFLTLLGVPQVVFNLLGLTLYNAFPEKPQLQGSPLLAPFLCVRTVTRGDFPELVKTNIQRNMKTCLDVGLENFMLEVVTDKPVNIFKHPRIREIVVPSDYHTKTNALFKSRALQYCLEDEVNLLSDNDWIVHLDEETLLTENSVRGILNFITEGTAQFGQGLITYANENIVNWITTLADSFRVADDMGKLRFQFKMFHKPLFGWKGSYVVTQVAAEKDISFDNGLDGSIAEDCYFGMKASHGGYKFGFVEGEMWEKSPFTFWDFLQQRKRWIQGILLVVHSKMIPLKTKIFLAFALYSWVMLPLITSNLVVAVLFPIPVPILLNIMCNFVGGVNVYMYIFGVLKSFSFHRSNILQFFLRIIGSVCTIPFNLLIENTAVIWGVLGKKHTFYIVRKDVNTIIV